VCVTKKRESDKDKEKRVNGQMLKKGSVKCFLSSSFGFLTKEIKRRSARLTDFHRNSQSLLFKDLTPRLSSLQVSISSTFYKQLSHVQIPKAQKDTDDSAVFLPFWDLRMLKLLIKLW